MDTQKIIGEFFNLDLPCPKEIPMCEQLRVSYNNELKKFESSGGCSSCFKSRLKSKFIEAILNEIASNHCNK